MPYTIASNSGLGAKPTFDKIASEQTAAKAKGKAGMGRLVKLVGLVLVLGFAGLVGYAYLADMTPMRQEVKQPVVLNAE